MLVGFLGVVGQLAPGSVCSVMPWLPLVLRFIVYAWLDGCRGLNVVSSVVICPVCVISSCGLFGCEAGPGRVVSWWLTDTAVVDDAYIGRGWPWGSGPGLLGQFCFRNVCFIPAWGCVWGFLGVFASAGCHYFHHICRRSLLHLLPLAGLGLWHFVSVLRGRRLCRPSVWLWLGSPLCPIFVWWAEPLLSGVPLSSLCVVLAVVCRAWPVGVLLGSRLRRLFCSICIRCGRCPMV